ncbi:MAG: NADPH-dependent oxidoreductase [Caldilineaceae bacterium]|nr:NADPH-dependent oxidoreductase [Caldilineaceae bacterium]
MTAVPLAQRNRFELLAMEAVSDPVLDLLASHASCRSYRPDPLPPGTLERLMVAGQSAPTSSNLQAYSVVAVEDPARKEALMALCGNQRMIKECPLFLVFCPDIHRLHYVCARQGYPFGAAFLEMFLLASVDAALVAQNVATAAEAMGLGSCMCGSIRNDPQAVIELLELPPGVFALVGLCVGYPAKPLEVKARLPIETILHHERYSTDDMESGVHAYDRLMAAGRTYDGRRVSISGEPDTSRDDSYGWAEHTARRLTRPETIAASASLRENLRRILEAHGWSFQ